MSHLQDNLRFSATVSLPPPPTAAPLRLAVFPSVLRRSIYTQLTAGPFWLRPVSGTVSGLWEWLVVLLLVCAKKVARIYTEIRTATSDLELQLWPNHYPTSVLFIIYSYYIWYDMIYLLTAIGLSPGGSSTVHIYTQTIHRTIWNK